MADIVLTKNRDYSDLDLDKFARSLDDPSECYKFYWLEAIISLLNSGKTTFTFEEIIDRMIASVWYTVTTYHLHLGPRRDVSTASNNMELAVDALNSALQSKGKALAKDAPTELIIAEMHQEDKAVRKYKATIAQTVPYFFLSQFITVPKTHNTTNNWRKPQVVVPIINETFRTQVIPYNIIHMKDRLQSQVVMNEKWAEYLINEQTVIKEWLQYKKIVFLQARNPGVPGIIYKLEPEKQRNYENVRKLWNILIDRNDFMDIYSRQSLQEEGRYDLDHFVPWSYVACDELWNLTPTNHTMNIQKSDHLPDWDLFSKDMVDQQYCMYRTVVDRDDSDLNAAFSHCLKTNLNAAWAVGQLYNPANSETVFKNMLHDNLENTYKDALNSGFSGGFRGYKQLQLEI